MATKAKTKALVRFLGTGRRKSSIARVILLPGKGKVTVNERDVYDYFPYEILVNDLLQPLEFVEAKDKYDVIVNVQGGGFTGQAGAIRLGIARALLEALPESRAINKKMGMLTRDDRSKERKKPGLKSARRAPQFSKR